MSMNIPRTNKLINTIRFDRALSMKSLIDQHHMEMANSDWQYQQWFITIRSFFPYASCCPSGRTIPTHVYLSDVGKPKAFFCNVGTHCDNYPFYGRYALTDRNGATVCFQTMNTPPIGRVSNGKWMTKSEFKSYKWKSATFIDLLREFNKDIDNVL